MEFHCNSPSLASFASTLFLPLVGVDDVVFNDDDDDDDDVIVVVVVDVLVLFVSLSLFHHLQYLLFFPWIINKPNFCSYPIAQSVFVLLLQGLEY